MSLINRFAANTLCIGLTPAQLLCIVREGAAFAAPTAHRHAVGNDENDWRPVLNALQIYLQQADRPGRGLPVSVALPSRWCRLAMAPWSDAMLTEEGIARFLQSQYTALHGDGARDWVFATDDAGYGQPRLACGIERELLQDLQQLVVGHQHRCEAVEPIVSIAWRAVAASAGAGIGAFAVVEADWLTLCHVANGRIATIQSQPCSQMWPVELVRAWQRWALRLPELAGIAHVAVVNLSGDEAKPDLPDLFKTVVLPSCELAPAYAFVTCGRGR